MKDGLQHNRIILVPTGRRCGHVYDMQRTQQIRTPMTNALQESCQRSRRSSRNVMIACGQVDSGVARTTLIRRGGSERQAPALQV